MIDRSTRPPSSGKAGNRLKTATTVFKPTRYNAMAAIEGSGPSRSSAFQTTQKNAASAKLANGPTMAIMNSALGLGGSCFISETPPRANNVIPAIGTRRLWAIRACMSSWTSTEPKRKRAAMIALIQ